MKRFCFINNPAANSKRSVETFHQLKSIVSTWPTCVETIQSESRGDIRSLSNDAAQRFDVVVACGGDGTVSDVAAGVYNTKAALGIIPMGSGNDFAKVINVPVNVTKALEILRNGRSKKIDIGRCNDFYFINTLGFGFDGLTNRFASNSDTVRGVLRYPVAALKANWAMRPFSVTIDSIDFRDTLEGIMVTFANGRVEGGNFIVAPNAVLDDGLLDLVIVRPVSRWILPFLLPVFILGKQEKLPWVVSHQGKKFSVSFEQGVYIHADGENIYTEEKQFTVESVPSALEVIGGF